MNRILVTGVPRSGTTFVGRVLALAKDTSYLWEPFNSKYRKGVPDYYPYIGPSSPPEKVVFYSRLINTTLQLRELRANVTIHSSDGLFRRLVKQCGVDKTQVRWTLTRLKALVKPPTTLIIKDPIATFLSRFLIEQFGFMVVVVARHPGAVYCSRRALGWDFDFSWWLKQADMRNDLFLVPGRLPPPENRLACSVTQWRIAYDYLLQVCAEFRDQSICVRHEDLCLDPIGQFSRLYHRLGLRFDDEVSRSIVSFTTGKDLEAKGTDKAVLRRRNARKLVDKWKKKISQEEIQIIEELAGSPYEKLYDCFRARA